MQKILMDRINDIIGEDEVKNNTVSVKNMVTGEQVEVQNDVLKILEYLN